MCHGSQNISSFTLDILDMWGSYLEREKERGDSKDFVQIFVASDEDSYESVSILTVPSVKSRESWFMDSGFY